MNKNQQNIIEHLQRMDEDGDGTISLLEIIYMEKKFQKSKKQQKKLKFLVMSMFFVFILLMLVSLPWRYGLSKRKKLVPQAVTHYRSLLPPLIFLQWNNRIVDFVFPSK